MQIYECLTKGVLKRKKYFTNKMYYIVIQPALESHHHIKY